MKILILSILVIATMASCSKTTSEQQEMNNTPELIAFGSSILAEADTKAIPEGATQFVDGDKINVIGYKNPTEPTNFISPFIDNVEYTYAAGTGFKTPTPLYYWERNAVHHFYAYYQSTTDNVAYTAGTASASPQIEVTVAAGVGVGNDLMGASVSNTAGFVKDPAAGNLCALRFTHKLSKVKFAIKKESNEVPDAVLSELKFTMASNKATYNIATEAFGTFTAAPVVLTKTGLTHSVNSATAVPVANTEWLVLPGDAISTIAAKIGGQDIAVSGLTTDLKTQPGKMTIITLTLKGYEIVFTSSIAAWDESTQPGTGNID